MMYNQINKLRFFLVLLIGTLLMPAMAKNFSDRSVVKVDVCAIENKAFQSGEKLTYKLYYNWNFVWLPAGEVDFSINEVDNSYLVTAIGTTYPSYEWFYKVHDVYASKLDKETLLPKVSVRDINEGKYTLYDKTELDQESNVAKVARGRAKNKIKENIEIPIENCMHDILSMLYYARNIDYNAMRRNTEFPLKVFLSKEQWPIDVVYEGKETEVKVKGLGKFNTIKFSPKVDAENLIPVDAVVDIWVSDDANKIPLIVESPLSVGSVKAVLKDYSGLRHSLSSKIK